MSARRTRPASTLFVNGLVIDGLGGHAERSAVLVEGDTIAAVGSAAEAGRSTTGRVIDLGGRTLMPGMILSHVHLSYNHVKDLPDLDLPLLAIAGARDDRYAEAGRRIAAQLRDPTELGLFATSLAFLAMAWITLTVGGNMANATPSADVAPALIALDATAKIAGADGERAVALADFFTGPGQTVMRSDEILTEITVPTS